MTSPLDSYKASLDKLRFDDESKARMASNLGAAAAARIDAQTRIVELPKGATRHRPKRRLTLVAACLAACLVVGGGGGVAVAAGVLPNPADVLSDVFGGAPAETELLNEVGRPIGASATSNGVTVTAEAVVGDRSNFTVVYDVEFDDPSVLEGIEPNENGVLPLVADAACHVDGTVAGGGAAWFYDADPGDDTIQYAESMGFTTWNGAGIVGRTMRFSMDGIRTVEGEELRRHDRRPPGRPGNYLAGRKRHYRCRGGVLRRRHGRLHDRPPDRRPRPLGQAERRGTGKAGRGPGPPRHRGLRGRHHV